MTSAPAAAASCLSGSAVGVFRGRDRPSTPLWTHRLSGLYAGGEHQLLQHHRGQPCTWRSVEDQSSFSSAARVDVLQERREVLVDVDCRTRANRGLGALGVVHILPLFFLSRSRTGFLPSNPAVSEFRAGVGTGPGRSLRH